MHKNINFYFTKFKSFQSSDEKSIKNLNSLCDYNMDCYTTTTTAASVASSTRSDYHSLSVSDSESETTSTADFATAFASQRFFFSSPGLSNSIVESTSASSSLASTSSSSMESDTIAVSKYSMDPLVDFRLSMQEMVEARELIDVNSNWDYLHELLMRYLSLNPKSTHKFIVGAFSDLLVSMMTPPASESCLNK